jgi:hypothetical protein
VKLTAHFHLVQRSKNACSYTSTPQYAFMAWCSVKAQGQLYLYFPREACISLFKLSLILFYPSAYTLIYFALSVFIRSCESSVGIALGYGLDIVVLGFDSQQGLGIFLFTTAPRTALGPTQPPIQRVSGAFSLG